jgi:N-methylhydantoinase A
VFFHGEAHHTPVYNRAALIPGDAFSGPAIITEYSSATILPPGDRLRVDELDNLIIEVH